MTGAGGGWGGGANECGFRVGQRITGMSQNGISGPRPQLAYLRLWVVLFRSDAQDWLRKTESGTAVPSSLLTENLADNSVEYRAHGSYMEPNAKAAGLPVSLLGRQTGGSGSPQPTSTRWV
jgi:hypothetical protein